MQFKRTFIVKVHIYPIVVIDELSIKLERTHLPVLYIIQIEQLLFQKKKENTVFLGSLHYLSILTLIFRFFAL